MKTYRFSRGMVRVYDNRVCTVAVPFERPFEVTRSVAAEAIRCARRDGLRIHTEKATTKTVLRDIFGVQ